MHLISSVALNQPETHQAHHHISHGGHTPTHLGTPNAVAVSVPLIISTAVAVGANKL